jgi:hypothetical protein
MATRFYGRKGGSKVLEFPVRPPSKKQIKKKSRLMERLSAKRDPPKEAIKKQQISKQVQSPEFKQQLTELATK